MSPSDRAFEEYRPVLARPAYRMLGSITDTEDVLQDAYLKWKGANQAAIQSPRAYLCTIVTRLCIDMRQRIDECKSRYVGPWLPEPVVEPDRAEPGSRLETAESVSMALLMVLESLSPAERAAYLLRRVFDYGYDEIADVLDKPEPSCRQLVSRAEGRILERRPRFEPKPDEVARLTEAFIGACSNGDLNGLVGLLASDAVLYSDGGGKVPAALAPIRGADSIARFLVGIMKKAPADMQIQRVRVNGQPGLLILVGRQIVNVLTLDVAMGRIAACFIVRNPDKLAHVEIVGTSDHN